jgi:peptidoglycan/LPS O-acetylase OafA/YrhL
MKQRNYFLDNIRWLALFLLFPFHSFIIFNNFGEGNYIKGPESAILSKFLSALWPWFMPLLFVVSGISSMYALRKRTIKMYIVERVKKLFIPLFFGIIFICPFLTFFAEKFHNGYTGTYIQQYILFFTKETNLTGYNGGFTPAHLWFILFLFIISIAAAPFFYFIPKKINPFIDNINIFILFLLFLIPYIGHFLLNIGGRSIGEYFCYFLFGYYIFSNENVIEKCKKYRWLFGIISIISLLVYLFLGNNTIHSIIERFYGMFAIMFIFGISKVKLNFTNKITEYFSNISFGLYLFHLPFITIIAYYLLQYLENVYLQAVIITISSIPITILTVEIFRRNIITRFMFCLKK